MKLFKIVLLVSALVAVMSCSKTEKTDIKLLFTIDGNFEPETVAEYDRKFTVISDIEEDKDGNIYLFNPRMERILKLDHNGQYIKYFGSRGTWKGEMMNAVDFTIMNDTVYVRNNFTPLIIRYTLDGEYIDDFQYEDGKLHFGEVIKAVSEDKFVGYLSEAAKEGEDIIHTNRLAIIDKKFKKTAVLREYKAKFDKSNPQFFEFITRYAFGNGKIYVAENETDKYRISVYDLEGNKMKEISKNYSKVEYNSYEKGLINSMPLKATRNKDEYDTLQTKQSYKKSINKLFYDKYGRLLVCPSIKRTGKNQNDFIADVFENDKYVKTIMIPQLKGEDFLHRFDSEIYFIGNRIYEVLHKEMKVNVYEY